MNQPAATDRPSLDLVAAIGAADRWLAVIITSGDDRTEIDAAVVNAAPITHPVDGRDVVAFVARRGAKLANLRSNPTATLVFRAGWDWVAVQGDVELAGPDDAHLGIDDRHLIELMRDIYHAAGGHHDDLDTYDTTITRERRCAVLITPRRIWSNPTHARHLDHDQSSDTNPQDIA